MFDEVGTACCGVGQQLHTAKVLNEVCLKAESLEDKQTLRGITRALSRQRGREGDQEAVDTVLLVKMCIINQTKEGVMLLLMCMLGQLTAFQQARVENELREEMRGSQEEKVSDNAPDLGPREEDAVVYLSRRSCYDDDREGRGQSQHSCGVRGVVVLCRGVHGQGLRQPHPLRPAHSEEVYVATVL